MSALTACTLCPRRCGIDRTCSTGYCGAGASVEIAHIMIHHWEEPCISGDPLGERGSGTIFFSHCPLGCVFCQNGKISRRCSVGRKVTAESLAGEMLALENKGAYNINFVSPTHYTPQIIEAIQLAREKADCKPLTVPVVWNTGGYELSETLEMLHDTVDIFLTDFKYVSPALAKKYSAAEDYPEYAAASLEKMLAITGDCVFGEDGMMKRGVIVRHLVLPGHRDDSIDVLHKIAETVDVTKIRLSLMAQYTPEFLPAKTEEDPYAKIRRKITTYEYNKVAEEARILGFDGYMQERSSAVKNFTPDF